MMRRIGYCLAMTGALAAPAAAQEPTIRFNVPGPADWNVAPNWVFGTPEDPMNVVPGDGFAEDVALIGNGGTATLRNTAGWKSGTAAHSS